MPAPLLLERAVGGHLHVGRVEPELTLSSLAGDAAVGIFHARRNPPMGAPSPRMPLSNRNSATFTMVSGSAAPLAKLTASAGVIEHLGRGELRLVARQGPCPTPRPWRSARRSFLVSADMIPISSYHAPTSALPKSGFAASVSVFTTMQVDDLSGNVGGIEQLVRARLLQDGGNERVPRHHRLHVVRGIGRDHVGIGCVEDPAEIGL